MALTIRPTDEQQDILAKVQRLTAEVTYSKAIFKGLTEYIQLKKEFEELEKKYQSLTESHSELKDTVALYVMARTKLERSFKEGSSS